MPVEPPVPKGEPIKVDATTVKRGRIAWKWGGKTPTYLRMICTGVKDTCMSISTTIGGVDFFTGEHTKGMVIFILGIIYGIAKGLESAVSVIDVNGN